MSTELEVIPRAELRRARNVATHRVGAAFVLIGLGIAGTVSAFFAWPLGLATVIFATAGVVGTGVGIAGAVHAMRARSTIEEKLRAQELPAARVIR